VSINKKKKLVERLKALNLVLKRLNEENIGTRCFKLTVPCDGIIVESLFL